VVSGVSAPRGRRRGGPDTRGEILEAARTSFADKGFRATTIRGVAAAAGVDAALVHHYFGTKDDLFIASLQMPLDPRDALASVFAPGTEGAGQRLLEAALGVWDQPEGRQPLVAVVRDSLGEPGGSLLREGFLRVVLKALRDTLPPEESELRAQLVASQMLGLVIARYVLELEPLATLPRAEVVRLVAPTLQRYLDGPVERAG
jgi:AcrR family transcriptional regulator